MQVPFIEVTILYYIQSYPGLVKCEKKIVKSEKKEHIEMQIDKFLQYQNKLGKSMTLCTKS